MFVSDTAPLKERGQCAPELRASELKRRASRRSQTGRMHPRWDTSHPTPQLQMPETAYCSPLVSNQTESSAVKLHRLEHECHCQVLPRQGPWLWYWSALWQGRGMSVEQAESVQRQRPKRQRKGRVRERRQRGGDASRQTGEGDADHRRRNKVQLYATLAALYHT